MRRRDLLALAAAPALHARRGLRVAVFSADVTPPLGAPLCYALVPPAGNILGPLQARGLILLPEGQKPIVLCSVDWLGIGNESHARWKREIAAAARTSADRVAVHTVHQHDAPGCDESAAALLPEKNWLMPDAFTEEARLRTTKAVASAKAVTVTAVKAGSAAVEGVASNRRVLSDAGKVVFGRMTACRNSPQCDAPIGTIDPMLESLSFWSAGQRVATLSYYATHPMSYYGKGEVSSDFVGMARGEQNDTFQIHFTGAAGNIGAGKFNDGSPAMRPVLVGRMAKAMRAAKDTEKEIPFDSIGWRVKPVVLPHRTGDGFGEADIEKALGDPKLERKLRANNARYLAFYRRTRTGAKIELSTLQIGPAHVLHMPGELFVEYQLAARAERRGETVMTAAYGDYGPMYIGTRKAYDEGGYETSAVSRVSPDVEDVLLSGVRELLG